MDTTTSRWLLYEVIEGDNQSDFPGYGIAMTLLVGAVAGGLIGWLVYRIRQ
jgi:hypothetical protein